MLRAAGQEQNHLFLIERAVEIAREATVECGREHTSAVAGSMSHMIPHMAGTDMVDPALGDVPPGFEDDCEQHASALLAADVDMILLEMMYHPDRAAIAARSGWYIISRRIMSTSAASSAEACCSQSSSKPGGTSPRAGSTMSVPAMCGIMCDIDPATADVCSRPHSTVASRAISTARSIRNK